MVRVAAKLIVLFVLVYTGVTIWYGRVEESLLQRPVVEEKAQIQATAEKVEDLRQPNDYTIIARRNIFQAAITKVEKKEPEVEEKVLEPTKLKLSLMGTISGKGSDARAIISDDVKRKQDIYQVGDSIQGALIKEIERGRVVLSVNKSDEVLTLKDREGGGPSYEPSPSDFYQEPKAPEIVEQRGDRQNKVVEQGGVQQRRPNVRPRPLRRPPRPVQNQQAGSTQTPGDK